MGLHSEADDGKDSVRRTGITADVAAGSLSGLRECLCVGKKAVGLTVEVVS